MDRRNNRELTQEEFEYAVYISCGGLHPLNKPEFDYSYKKSKNVVVLRRRSGYVTTVNIDKGQEIWNPYHPG